MMLMFWYLNFLLAFLEVFGLYASRRCTQQTSAVAWRQLHCST